MSIFTIITLFIVICGLIEMIFSGFLFNFSGQFPTYFEIFENIENSDSGTHFWIFLIVFVIQIIFLIILGFKYHRKKTSNKNTELSMEIKNESQDNLNSDFITPTPIDMPS